MITGILLYLLVLQHYAIRKWLEGTIGIAFLVKGLLWLLNKQTSKLLAQAALFYEELVVIKVNLNILLLRFAYSL